MNYYQNAIHIVVGIFTSCSSISVTSHAIHESFNQQLKCSQSSDSFRSRSSVVRQIYDLMNQESIRYYLLPIGYFTHMISLEIPGCC